MKPAIFLTMIACIVLSSACGNKGPLVLPAPQSPPAQLPADHAAAAPVPLINEASAPIRVEEEDSNE